MPKFNQLNFEIKIAARMQEVIENANLAYLYDLAVVLFGENDPDVIELKNLIEEEKNDH